MVVHVDKKLLDEYLANVGQLLTCYRSDGTEGDIIKELRQQHIHMVAEAFKVGLVEAEIEKLEKYCEALGDEDRGFVQEALDNAVLDLKEEDGSNVNNEGFSGQIRLLVAESGLAFAKDTVEEAVPKNRKPQAE